MRQAGCGRSMEAHELVEIEKHKRVAGEAAKKKLEIRSSCAAHGTNCDG